MSQSDQILSLFRQNSDEYNLLTFPLHDPTAVSQLPWQSEGEEKEKKLNQIKSLQRIARLTPVPDIDLAQSLHAANLDSAHKITSMSKADFVKTYQQVANSLPQNAAPSDLSHEEVANHIYDKASEVRAKTLHLWANLQSVHGSPHTQAMRVNSVRVDDQAQLVAALPSYQEIFGSLNYCECDHCKSIFSPAAYLVDLLRMVDSYITQLNPNTIHTNWKLDSRRHDISTLPLTCENTNATVPYLSIVNTVVENLIRNLSVITSGMSVDQYLSTAIYPVQLPYHNPLATIRSTLALLKTDLYTIYRICGQTEVVQTREALGLSPKEYELITTPTPASFATADDQALLAMYGLPATAELSVLSDVDTFLNQTGLTPDDLNVLLYQNLGPNEIKSGLTQAFYINVGSIPPLSISTADSTHIENVTKTALHRVNRFIRLAKTLGWSYTDLDWALQVIGGEDPLVTGLATLAQIKQISERFQHSVAVTCSFLADMKTSGAGGSTPSQALFDLVFNTPSAIGGKPSYHPRDKGQGSYSKNPLYTDYDNGPSTWDWNQTDHLATMQNGSFIASGVGVSLDELKLLGTTFFTQPIDMSVSNLSILYRHSKLASVLGLRIQPYLTLLGLVGIKSATLSTEQLNTIIHAATWVKTSGLSIYQLDYLINNGSTTYVTAKYNQEDPDRLTSFLNSLQGLIHTTQATSSAFVADIINEALSATYYDQLSVKTGVFASGIMIVPASSVTTDQLQPVTDQVIASIKATLQNARTNQTLLQNSSFVATLINQELSNQIFITLTHAGLIDTNGNLTSSYSDSTDLSAISILLNNQIQNSLPAWEEIASDTTTKLIEQLASFLGSQTDKIRSLIPIAVDMSRGVLPKDVPNYLLAFLSQTPDLVYINAFMSALSRWLMLTDPLRLTSSQIDAIANRPGVFQIKTFADPLAFGSVIDIVTFRQLIIAFNDTTDGFVQLVYDLYPPTPQTLIAQSDTLAKLTNWDATQTHDLLVAFYSNATDSPNNDPEQDTTLMRHISRLKQAFDLGNKLGVDMAFLQRLNNLGTLTDADWQTYLDTADAVMTTVKSRYDADTWPTVYSSVNQTLLENKRDVLLDTALWQLPLQPSESGLNQIRSAQSLSEYLLIDVEMSGCADISPIVQAIASVQQYLQRCRLNLEPGVISVGIHPIWWEWMMNYRIWEANRKVYLYPENYLDPALRNSKTALFKDLESTLLQGDITTQAVEDAYRTYIEGFSELAKLKHVDSYNCIVNDPLRGDIDTMFLFARTQSEPYIYYYCTLEDGKVWSEWQKIDITINAAIITPVYAFSKLFLFWVEHKNASNSSIESTSTGGSRTADNQVFTASTKFSFYNFQGRWIQPQTLGEEQVISYQAADSTSYPLTNEIPFRDSYEQEELYWNKVYALRVLPDSADNERISIMFGQMIATDSVGIVTIPALPDMSNPDCRNFNLNVYNSAVVLNGAISTANDAHVPLNQIMTLNTEMQQDSLMQSNEFLLLSKNSSGELSLLFEPQVDTVHGQFYIIQSDSALQSNYFGDLIPVTNQAKTSVAVNPKSFTDSATGITDDSSQKIYAVLGTYQIIDASTGYVSPSFNSKIPLAAMLGTLVNEQQAQLVQTKLFEAKGDPLLFNKISKQNGRGLVVKNKPNWLIFDNGDEAFLLKPREDLYAYLTDALNVQEPLMSKSSFIYGKVDAPTSEKVYNLLITYGLVSATTGKVNKGVVATFDLNLILGTVIPDQRQQRAVRNILLNYPLVQQSSLMSTGVNTENSTKIYAILTTYQIIDDAGRVSLDLLPGMDLSLLLADLGLSPKQLGKVRNMLFNAPSLMLLEYTGKPSSTQIISLHDYTFDTLRLTTSAIRHLSNSLFIGGIDQLLSLRSQQIPVVPQMPFDRLEPAYNVVAPLAIDGTQVDFDGAYGTYFWEIFFHVPWMIAMRLASNQQFDEAQKWLQYIFNPTLQETLLAPDSFSTYTRDIDPASSQAIYQALKTTPTVTDSTDSSVKKPAIDSAGRVETKFNAQTDLSFLKLTTGAPLTLQQTREVRNLLLNYQVATDKSFYWQFQPFRNRTLDTLEQTLSDETAIRRWNDDPFDPHAIAVLRLGAYEKAIVMQYIDVLIDWGDYMFAQDSWESITQATLLYQYAYDLLGPRPQKVGNAKEQPPATFEQIKAANPAGIPQFLIELENTLLVSPTSTATISSAGKPFNDFNAYFCVPENDQFIAYWDRVEDRLYKIRHCMNLAGITRQLDLFQPPLDPMQLVRAAATSNNVLSLANRRQQAIPNYRFIYMLEKAKNMTSTVIQLGSALLGALEKKDSSGLELLRTTHEENIQNLITQIKTQQVDEAKNHLDALQKSLRTTTDRSNHYQTLITNGLSSYEQSSQQMMAVAIAFQTTAIAIHGVAIAGYLAPNVFGLADGGMEFGQAIDAGARISDGLANQINQGAQLAAMMGEHDRRREEWEFQKLMADDEVLQIQSEIAASQIRLQIAQQELTVHKKNISQTKEIEDFLKSKFTNEDLYQWMIDRISQVYFQTYKIALEVAQNAQTAYQFELDSEDSYINMQYWDSLRRGLMAGESLMFALTQMERSYLDKNIRRLEIEKSISLMQINPEAFLQLKTTGKCNFSLDEILFDYDFPGHYSRQIKSLSITIPCIVSPYQNVNATLIQTSNSIVTSPNEQAVEFLLNRKQGTHPTTGLRENWAPNQQIAISRGVDDSGMFVLDFRDDRYLPFEGTGAVSSWELRLPKETNRINYESITDVIIQFKYTALSGGDSFQQTVEQKLANQASSYSLYVNTKQAFPASWNSLMHTPPENQTKTLSFTIDSRLLVPNVNQPDLQSIFIRLNTPSPVNSTKLLTVKLPDGTSKAITLLNSLGAINGLHLASSQFLDQPWVITVSLSEASVLGLGTDDALDPTTFINLEWILVYGSTLSTPSL
ncbi:neuraminidase-like domain-containing protein [Brevibacillus dissolubilis]|uniref:Tc toxin subunit A-related protein n=1 Tax=Brevibacillus dissolubilis TaxID=1844116 RepID=UPI00111669A3|nr:neuraminidase-like domain-containing protein [Brevibacillus dissolubilis]